MSAIWCFKGEPKMTCRTLRKVGVVLSAIPALLAWAGALHALPMLPVVDEAPALPTTYTRRADGTDDPRGRRAGPAGGLEQRAAR